ncbi:MAG: carbon-nitrogen hydrolase family protein [Bryobacterales bacterium]|nr:carbon-nitrogen hydrolase family protein [Bryobacterales bacterium]
MTSRVAVVQAGSILFDTPSTLLLAEDLVRQAARGGASLVVFPEAFLGGYPKGMDFGVTVGGRSAPGRGEFRRYLESAIEIPGTETQALSALAAATGTHLVMGCVERAGSTLYCCVLFLGPDGAILGKHRKVMPTAMERVLWGCGDASTLPVIPTAAGRLGAVICWENYMPLLRMAMYQQQVEVYCACTVDDREVWPSTMRHIAVEGRCFVLSACQYAPGLIRGGSLVANPYGELLAGPVYGREIILYADIDLSAIAEAKFDLDVAGHYARPDLFELRVQRQPQHTVRWMDAAAANEGESGQAPRPTISLPNPAGAAHRGDADHPADQ